MSQVIQLKYQMMLELGMNSVATVFHIDKILKK